MRGYDDDRVYDDDIIEVIICGTSDEFDITDTALTVLYEESLKNLEELDQCGFVSSYYKSISLNMPILRNNFYRKRDSIGIRANPILIKILKERPEYSLHKFTIKKFRIPHDILTDEDYRLYTIKDLSTKTETLCIDCPEVPTADLNGLSCTEF